MADFVQGASPLLINTPLGADKLLVKTFTGEERLSALFKFELELISTDSALDFSAIVGKPVTITMALASGDTQFTNGIVARFRQSGTTEDFTTYHVELRPWLWLLTMNSDCRIFQNMTAPDIIEQVFSDLSFSDYKNSLKATYNARDYCVQYMETSFSFVSRLMEEEGIFYFFEHVDGKHTLVLADDADTYDACTALTSVALLQSDFSWQRDIIRECSVEQNVVPGQFQIDDYNFETPSTDLLAKASGDDPSRSIYEYPGLYTKKDTGESITSRVLTGWEIPSKILRGSSTCRTFRSGSKFTLEGHPRSDANAAYVLVAVSHQTAAQNTEYLNTFEAIPATSIFRPSRTSKKTRIAGTQTATVVGKAGEEIWTDQYGRAKVKFHWDQSAASDETSSCWIRIAQGWAGKQWGSIFIPRIGQEVVVTFLEGDPDRPLITGSVYNAEQTVPYTLPDDQTKSTVKSNSSKGGNGFNEIRFEDKAGSEEVFVQAQKDMNVNVLNNLTSTVTKNDTFTVSGTRAVTVTGNETHTNSADHSWTISGNLNIKVTGNITIESQGSVTMKASMNVQNEAGMALTNKAGTNLTNDAGVSLTNKGSASQTVDGGGMLTVKGGLVKIN